MARKNRTLKDILKNSCSENLISLFQILMKYFSVNRKKMSEAYLGFCQTAMMVHFYENS